MGTRWGYRCLDCNEDSDTTFSNAERELSTLALNFSTVKMLLGLSIVEVKAIYGSQILVFLEEHDEHNIVLLKGWDETFPFIQPSDEP